MSKHPGMRCAFSSTVHFSLSQSLTQDVNRQKERENRLQALFSTSQSEVDDLVRRVYLASEPPEEDSAATAPNHRRESADEVRSTDDDDDDGDKNDNDDHDDDDEEEASSDDDDVVRHSNGNGITEEADTNNYESHESVNVEMETG